MPKRGIESARSNLRNLYYNLNKASSYTGAQRLHEATRGKYGRKEVKAWLEGQDSYNAHKLVKHRFPRRTYNVYNVDDMWEVDLCDLRKLKNYNDGFSYVLVCIDALSKFVYLEPMRDKSAQSTAEVLKRILSGGRRPLVLQSDSGKEFVGEKTQKNDEGKRYNV